MNKKRLLFLGLIIIDCCATQALLEPVHANLVVSENDEDTFFAPQGFTLPDGIEESHILQNLLREFPIAIPGKQLVYATSAVLAIAFVFSQLTDPSEDEERHRNMTIAVYSIVGSATAFMALKMSQLAPFLRGSGRVA